METGNCNLYTAGWKLGQFFCVTVLQQNSFFSRKPHRLLFMPSPDLNEAHSYYSHNLFYFKFVIVQLLSHAWLFATPWTAACQASLSFTVSQSLHKLIQFSQFSSVAQSCPTLCDPKIATRQASLSINSSRRLLKLMSIESVMPSSQLILGRPLLLLPPIPPSIRVFSNESTLRIRWPKYWSFGFSISSSNEHPGLISFRMDWLDLLAVQGTLKSLL